MKGERKKDLLYSWTGGSGILKIAMFSQMHLYIQYYFHKKNLSRLFQRLDKNKLKNYEEKKEGKRLQKEEEEKKKMGLPFLNTGTPRKAIVI